MFSGTHTYMYSGGILDRNQSVPKRSRERRACAGSKEASGQDIAVPSLPLSHPLGVEMLLILHSHIDAEILIDFSDRVVRGGVLRNVNPQTEALCNINGILSVCTATCFVDRHSCSCLQKVSCRCFQLMKVMSIFSPFPSEVIMCL